MDAPTHHSQLGRGRLTRPHDGHRPYRMFGLQGQAVGQAVGQGGLVNAVKLAADHIIDDELAKAFDLFTEPGARYGVDTLEFRP